MANMYVNETSGENIKKETHLEGNESPIESMLVIRTECSL